VGRENPDLAPRLREPWIAIKGHLARAPILAQEGNHRFDGCWCVEILSHLGRQGNRSACIHKVADFDHMLTLALRALFRRDGAYLLEIHLNLFHWLAEFVGMGWLFGTGHQATRGVQDFPDRSTRAGKRDLCSLQLRVTRKVGEQGSRPRHSRSAFSGGAKRICTSFCVTRKCQRK
jgi:hypothetical protein